MQAIDFVVARNDLQQCKMIETQLPDAAALPDDALLVKVTRFAFTANNITYAVLGDRLKYWQLFPAPEGFGNIPVWGFGEVIASKHPAVADRRNPVRLFPDGDASRDRGRRRLASAVCAMRAAHRQGVAPVYNAYTRVSGDPAFAGKQGDYQALLRPLFMLSFLVDDFLAENEFFGAKSGDALLGLQQDRLRPGAPPACEGQRHQGDRLDLGGQHRLCHIARLLRRGRNL